MVDEIGTHHRYFVNDDELKSIDQGVASLFTGETTSGFQYPSDFPQRSYRILKQVECATANGSVCKPVGQRKRTAIRANVVDVCYLFKSPEIHGLGEHGDGNIDAQNRGEWQPSCNRMRIDPGSEQVDEATPPQESPLVNTDDELGFHHQLGESSGTQVGSCL